MEEKKAIKLTEKMFTIYDDARAAQKNRKRSHVDDKDKDKDKDTKKSKIKDVENNDDKLAEPTLSPDKV